MKARSALYFILTLFCSLPLHAQIQWCANPNPAFTVPEDPSFRKPSGTIVSVPVIFHVIYDASGNGNVPESQLLDQLDTLNATHARAGSQFSFYLAAISRIKSTAWWDLNFYERVFPYDQPSQTEIEMTNALAIDPKHAFNIYISRLVGGVLGWVIYFPWQVSEDSPQNGVIIDYRSLPGGDPPYDYGYVLVHEGGHHLGLYHTFQNGCNPPGDEVDDTPYQYNGNNVFVCDENLDTCPADPGNDLVHNYMNYTVNSCMNMFTSGQNGRASSITGQHKPSLGGTELYFASSYTVSGGRSLKLFPGITLRFASGTGLTINGALDVNGTSSSKVTFTRDGTSGLWGGIRINSTGIADFDYALILYASRGVDLNSTSLNMYFSEIKNCTYGLYASNSTIYDVQDNLIRYNTYYGVYLYDTYAELMENEIVGNSWGGIYLISGSFGDITYSAINNNGINAEGWYSCSPYIQNNTIGEYLEDYTMRVYYNTDFYADYNVWSEGCPTSGEVFIGSGCTVDISPPCSPLSKVVAMTPPVEGNSLTDYDPNLPIRSNLRNARKLMRRGEYQAAKEIARHIITTFPDSAVTVHALNLYRIVSRKEGTTAALADLLADLSTQKKKTDLVAHAEFWLAKFEDEDRIARLDKIIQKYPGMLIVEMALLDQFMYYLNEVEDIEKAREIADKIDRQFPDSQLAIEVHRQLGDEAYLAQHNQAKEEESSRSSNTLNTPEKFELHGNYPNPFNPETNIRYGIPTTAEVSLEIYNLRGEKVASLVHATQPAGRYNVTWDGRDSAGRTMASGVYLCRMRAGSFVQTRKLMLLK